HREPKRDEAIHTADRKPADDEIDELGKAESTHCVRLAWKARGSPQPQKASASDYHVRVAGPGERPRCVLTRPPIGPAFSHFGHHSGASILYSATSGRGSMGGTAIRIILRAAGVALPALVFCAAPAAAQFSFPFGAPAPSAPAPGMASPNA